MKKQIFSLVAGFVATAALSSPASAALVTFTTSMSIFTYDSDTVNGGFNAALGGGYTHESFDGYNSGNVIGSTLSADVTFSTIASSYGGVTSTLVNAADEIGPYNRWDGILDMYFNGGSVSAVGFGLVNPVATIKIFGTSNNLLGTFNNNLNTTFSLWGVQATGGEQIGRVQLDGRFYAIQDLEYSTPNGHQVPDSGSTAALLALGLACLGARRRRSV